MNHQLEEKEAELLPQEYQKQGPLQRRQNDDSAVRVKITYYTDPLCCWSWAFENVWNRFIREHASDITYDYVLGGMIRDWNSYKDDMNSVSRPMQMGPVWMHASQVTGVPMKYSIWHEDPPSSSFPSCIAIRTAGLQSAEAAELYLRETRKALMTEGKNISKPSILLELAETLDGAGLHFKTFQSDWQAGHGKAAFKRDLEKVKLNNIGRYPTLTFQNETGNGIMIVGYRPYDVLLQAYEKYTTTSH